MVLLSNKFAFLDEDAADELPPKKEAKEVKKQPKKEEPKKENKPRDTRPRDANNRGRGGKGKGGGRGGKRDFDRHVPGTGRRDTQKRGGGGKYNWGTDGDESSERPPRRNNNRDNRNRNNRDRDNAPQTEAAAEPKEAPKETTEDGVTATPDAAASAEATEAVDAPEPEPEPVTYEEYLEAQKAKALEEDNIEAREVQNDDSQWKTSSAFVKEEAEAGQIELGGGKKKFKKKNKKETGKVNIDEFMSSGSGGNNRRRGKGKGGGRGGKGNRGGGRGLVIDDSNFPTLG